MLFLDMDGVLTDFKGACEELDENMMLWYSNERSTSGNISHLQDQNFVENALDGRREGTSWIS
jgi:beta-phosphoglucomutase-like phosphatase (HAD superfamily)